MNYTFVREHKKSGIPFNLFASDKLYTFNRPADKCAKRLCYFLCLFPPPLSEAQGSHAAVTKDKC